MIFARPLTQLFMSAEGDTALAIESGASYVTIVAPFYLIVNVKVLADDVVRGTGGNLGFTISTFTDLILRVALVFILTRPLGFAGVGWAWAIGWSLGAASPLRSTSTFPASKNCAKKGAPKSVNLRRKRCAKIVK